MATCLVNRSLNNVFFYSFLFLFSSHVRAESGFWDPGNFCWCNPEARNYLLAQSGSQLISAVKSGILGFGNRNIAQRIRSPTNDWNPESNFRRQRIRKQGNFCWWNPESSKFLLSKPESWALELKESRIQVPLIENGIQYLKSGIQGVEPRLQDCFGFPYIGRKTTSRTNVFFTLFFSWFYRLPAIWSLAGFTTIGRTLVICTVKLLGLTVVISQCSWLKQSTP